MKNYTVRYMPEASQDVQSVYEYIAFKQKMPLSARRYYNGIFDAIDSLAIIGPSIAVTRHTSLLRLYGPRTRTIIYKKMTIVYNVIGETVYIRRIMASSLIP
jgi:plasmid stabilization system protein ParE